MAMHRVVSTVVVVAVAVFVQGCGFHRVSLRAVPESSAPLSERVRAYKDLAPESGLATNYYKNGVYQGTQVNWLLLGDGTRVEDPRDLVPVVDPNSPTVAYAQSFETKLAAAKLWYTMSLVGMGLGIGAAIAPTLITGGRSPNMTAFTISLGVGVGLLTASLVALLVGMANGGQAQSDRVAAFQTYPRALQKRLALDEDPPATPGGATPASAMRWTDAPVRLALGTP